MYTLRESWSSSFSSMRSPPSIADHLFLIDCAAYICHLNSDSGAYVTVKFKVLANIGEGFYITLIFYKMLNKK